MLLCVSKHKRRKRSDIYKAISSLQLKYIYFFFFFLLGYIILALCIVYSGKQWSPVSLIGCKILVEAKHYVFLFWCSLFKSTPSKRYMPGLDWLHRYKNYLGPVSTRTVPRESWTNLPFIMLKMGIFKSLCWEQSLIHTIVVEACTVLGSRT